MRMLYMELQFQDYNQRASAQSIHQQQRAEQQNGQLAQMPIRMHEYLTHWGAETSMKCAAAGNRGAPGAQGSIEAGGGAAQVTPADLAGIVGPPSKKRGGEKHEEDARRSKHERLAVGAAVGRRQLPLTTDIAHPEQQLQQQRHQGLMGRQLPIEDQQQPFYPGCAAANSVSGGCTGARLAARATA